MAIVAETFTDQTLDPVTLMREPDLSFGNDQAEAGAGAGNITPQNGEIAIATFAFRGVKNGVKLAGLREP